MTTIETSTGFQGELSSHSSSIASPSSMELASAVSLEALVRGTAPMPTKSGCPLFITTSAPLDESGLRLVEALSIAGHRIGLFLSPVGAGGPGVARFGLGDAVMSPSEPDPLVASSEAHLTGRGAIDGLRLAVGDAVTLLPRTPDTDVLAVDGDGRPVILELHSEHGAVVVVGSTSLLREQYLGARDNLRLLTYISTGQVDDELAGRIASTCLPFHDHRPVLAVSVSAMDPLPTAPQTLELVRAAGRARRLLPAEVHDALVDFADSPDPSGALLLRGLPVGDIGRTPDSPTATTTKDSTSEMTLLTVARCLGQPIGYMPEHGGDLVQNIVPTKGAATSQTSTSSAVELMFHTEAAFHPYRPRYLLLLCLRGDPAAATTLASVHEVAPQLPLSVRSVLFEPRFRTAADESYVGQRPTRLGRPMPVLSGSWDSPSMVFDADLMVGMDDEAESALRCLADAVAACRTSAVLEAGDLLVVDNSIAVHGRTPFTPRFDGTDRWLQRTFVVADLAPSAADRHGRVITTRFMT